MKKIAIISIISVLMAQQAMAGEYTIGPFEVNSFYSEKIYQQTENLRKEIADKNLQIVSITGYADIDGDRATNLKLSQERAETVAGILGSNIGVSGQGEIGSTGNKATSRTVVVTTKKVGGKIKKVISTPLVNSPLQGSPAERSVIKGDALPLLF